MIDEKKADADGAVNGTGGMAGAVVCYMRGVNIIHSVFPGQMGFRVASELYIMAQDIFPKAELERAKKQVDSNYVG